jgi:serine/threonine-protein kinase
MLFLDRETGHEEVPFPERVGRYPLIAPIASGGLATVYLGKLAGIAGFERDVAVKLLHPHLRAERELAQHLIAEAKLAARIQHPNVVPVLDVGEDSHGIYLVMEYVEAETLGALLKAASQANERIPKRVALKILCDALRGLHAAHEATDSDGKPLGLVHRDFSPQNILVGVDGTTRLIDFGVAKVAQSDIHTRTGTVKGKVGYMSPEQARGKPVDRRCDVWAAGVVIWELFAGRRLFKTADEVATMMRVISDPIPPLAEVAPDSPPGARRATEAALCRDLDLRSASALELERFLTEGDDDLASAAQVAEWLKRIAGDSLLERSRRISAIRQRRVVEPPPTKPRLARVWLAVSTLAVVGIGVTAWVAWPRNQPHVSNVRAPSLASFSAEPRAGTDASVVVVANHPMRSLEVAGKLVEFREPTLRVQIPLSRAGSVTLTASSSDGRTTSYVSRGDESEIQLRFGDVPSPTPKPAQPKPKPKSGPAKLSPSPYAK